MSLCDYTGLPTLKDKREEPCGAFGGPHGPFQGPRPGPIPGPEGGLYGHPRRGHASEHQGKRHGGSHGYGPYLGPAHDGPFPGIVFAVEVTQTFVQLWSPALKHFLNCLRVYIRRPSLSSRSSHRANLLQALIQAESMALATMASHTLAVLQWVRTLPVHLY